MKWNQQGITLVELIVTLALVSIVATICWTALTIGLKHGTAETNNTIMQQDANLMISSLMAAHRGSDKYSIIFEDNQLKINSCQDDGSCVMNEISSKYNFTGSIINEVAVDSIIANPIVFADLIPKDKHTKLTLKITDLNNIKRTLTIETTLSRLLTNQN